MEKSSFDPGAISRLLARWSWLQWAFVYVCGLCLGFARGGHCSLERPNLCIDPYWLEHWLLDYSQGFQRRALLGALSHLFSLGHPDVVVLNVVAMATAVAIAACIITVLYRADSGFWGRMAIAVLAASPLCSVFFETLGDPLAVVFVLFLMTSFCMLRMRRVGRRSVHRPDSAAPVSMQTKRPVVVGAIVMALAFSFVAFLIHEAAIFLFLPAVVLVVGQRKRPNLGTYVRFATLAVPLLSISVLFGTNQRPDTTYYAINSVSGVVVPRPKAAFPAYSELLQKEMQSNFATAKETFLFLLRIPRTWFVPLLALVLVSGVIWRGHKGRMLWRLWLYLTICSLPLYVIARDWGRFSAITFWLAIMCAWIIDRVGLGSTPTAATPALEMGLSPRMPSEGIVFGVVASLIFAADAIQEDYRYQGMPIQSLILLGPAVIAWINWLGSRQPADDGMPPSPGNTVQGDKDVIMNERDIQ